MNGENPHLKNPLLLKSSLSSTSSTQHMWELLAGNCTAVLPLPVNQSKGHTYTNPQPSHYLTHAHSHITQAGSHGQRFRPYWGSTAWHGHSSVTGETCVKRPFPTEVSPLNASSTQRMWELLAGNRTATLPRHVWGRQIMGLVYVCPLLYLSLENSELNCSTT